MLYSIVGFKSGFLAHVLATFVTCWRRALRVAGIALLLAVGVCEVGSVYITRQFPPQSSVHFIALAFGVAVGYAAAMTIFAEEVVKGALRAVGILQRELAQAQGQPVATTVAGSLADSYPTPIPMRSPGTSDPLISDLSAVGIVSAASAPLVATGPQKALNEHSAHAGAEQAVHAAGFAYDANLTGLGPDDLTQPLADSRAGDGSTMLPDEQGEPLWDDDFADEQGPWARDVYDPAALDESESLVAAGLVPPAMPSRYWLYRRYTTPRDGGEAR